MFRSKHRLNRKVKRNRKFIRNLLALEQLESRLALDATVAGTADIDHIRVSPGRVPTPFVFRVTMEPLLPEYSRTLQELFFSNRRWRRHHHNRCAG